VTALEQVETVIQCLLSKPGVRT